MDALEAQDLVVCGLQIERCIGNTTKSVLSLAAVCASRVMATLLAHQLGMAAQEIAGERKCCAVLVHDRIDRTQ